MRNLVWFRRDLRIEDNRALFHAAESADDGVIGVYVVTPDQWRSHDDADCKIRFWMDNLRQLSMGLAKLNIPLIVQNCGWFSEIPQRLAELVDQHHCDGVYFNSEYEVNERARDRAVESLMNQRSIAVHCFDDRIIVPPEQIKTQQDKFYSVFTPYRKVWDTVAREFAEMVPVPDPQAKIDVAATDVQQALGVWSELQYRDDLWPAGEEAANKRLSQFASRISKYDDHRDLPAVNGTSLLSPYLAAGVISPRQCFHAAVAATSGRLDDHPGAKTWVSELAWRDFYTAVLVGWPRVSKHRPFKTATDKIGWRDDDSDFEAWKTGQTGYPIVDAGMRQLNQTGWMHNRLRMVVAMFLTKHLLIDWRLGEKYFMQQLIDGDLAANNGGWQWSASTGTDAVPYFRIFNPFSQSKRFDSDGAFIKKFCPELENVPSAALHDARKLAAAIEENELDYPGFVVDHKFARDRVLAEFKAN